MSVCVKKKQREGESVCVCVKVEVFLSSVRCRQTFSAVGSSVPRKTVAVPRYTAVASNRSYVYVYEIDRENREIEREKSIFLTVISCEPQKDSKGPIDHSEWLRMYATLYSERESVNMYCCVCVCVASQQPMDGTHWVQLVEVF